MMLWVCICAGVKCTLHMSQGKMMPSWTHDVDGQVTRKDDAVGLHLCWVWMYIVHVTREDVFMDSWCRWTGHKERWCTHGCSWKNKLQCCLVQCICARSRCTNHRKMMPSRFSLALDPWNWVMGRPIPNHEICYSNWRIALEKSIFDGFLQNVACRCLKLFYWRHDFWSH